MSMKNSNDTIGNRTRDLPACSAVPQPTTPPQVQYVRSGNFIREMLLCEVISSCKAQAFNLRLSGSGELHDMTATSLHAFCVFEPRMLPREINSSFIFVARNVFLFCRVRCVFFLLYFVTE